MTLSTLTLFQASFRAKLQNRLARTMKRKELKQAAVKAGKQAAVNIAAD